ncbi:substrate-binding domain-containing protein [Erythrobacter sp. LQ02-29]|uniref:substrate-binding domain-containing protein n=1 Tax=Erythrobacter sp. LQ02-29 TaxID=2920384 RepID=UPI001F4EF2AE|nr:substrate-binding domain-containing protein [Erythrobacter sp. LQ02-29]MCP9223646.1 substrate-binding domain-containing protein [Erythrobacter sp. LQ02-29]
MALSRRSVVGTGLVGSAALLSGCTRAPADIRIGFVVKMPQEQWFQDEWRFAKAAARDFGFTLIEIGAEDGDRVLSALWTLYARYAQGFIICAPDPRLGPAIAEYADRTGMKALAVDDRLSAPDGTPISHMPYVGISATAIGRLAGEAAATEARRRQWDPASTGVLRLAFDSLETAQERTSGAIDALASEGFSQVFDAPQRTSDTEGAFTAAAPVITANPAIDQWIIIGLNDESVIGGVRAAEGLSMTSGDIIGVGIGGSEAAVSELAKPTPTGFFATVLLSARRHGYDTAAAMYRWIKDGVRPPAVTLTSGTLMNRGNFRQILAREAIA